MGPPPHSAGGLSDPAQRTGRSSSRWTTIWAIRRPTGEDGRYIVEEEDRYLPGEIEFGLGNQVIDFLEELHFSEGRPLWPRDGICLHTSNSSARDGMRRAIENLPESVEVEPSLNGRGQPRFRINPARWRTVNDLDWVRSLDDSRRFSEFGRPRSWKERPIDVRAEAADQVGPERRSQIESRRIEESREQRDAAKSAATEDDSGQLPVPEIRRRRRADPYYPSGMIRYAGATGIAYARAWERYSWGLGSRPKSWRDFQKPAQKRESIVHRVTRRFLLPKPKRLVDS